MATFKSKTRIDTVPHQPILRLAMALCVLPNAVAIVTASATRWEIADGGNGHYYTIVVDDHASWTQSREAASAMRGYLATILSQGEQDFIIDLLVSQGSPTGGYWFGFTDEAVEGEWKWITGERTEYTNWHAGEPNNFRGEHHAHILWTATRDELNFDRRGGWNDMIEAGQTAPDPNPDLIRMGYVVESTPEPVSLSVWAVLLVMAGIPVGLRRCSLDRASKSRL